MGAHGDGGLSTPVVEGNSPLIRRRRICLCERALMASMCGGRRRHELATWWRSREVVRAHCADHRTTSGRRGESTWRPYHEHLIGRLTFGAPRSKKQDRDRSTSLMSSRTSGASSSPIVAASRLLVSPRRGALDINLDLFIAGRVDRGSVATSLDTVSLEPSNSDKKCHKKYSEATESVMDWPSSSVPTRPSRIPRWSSSLDLGQDPTATRTHRSRRESRPADATPQSQVPNTGQHKSSKRLPACRAVCL